jgi:thermopsin
MIGISSSVHYDRAGFGGSDFLHMAISVFSIFLLLATFMQFSGADPLHVNSGGGSGMAIQSTSPVTTDIHSQANINSVPRHIQSNGGNDSPSGILGFLTDRKIPSSDAYVPNFNAPAPLSYGTVSPTYIGYPAPMGIADYGLRTSNGRVVAYNLSTSGIEGKLQLNSSKAFYAGTANPESFSIQLNAVLNGVTVKGNSSFDYWTQNVALYSSRTHDLSFIDNVWNFSNPAISSTAFYEYNTVSHDSFPLFYYSLGPAIKVQYPFTVDLFLQSSVIDGRTAVFFNYSVSDSSITISGSYDKVIFNSLPTDQPGFTAPEPYYLASGTTRAPIGLLNDIEFVIGGPGGGSTTTLYSMSGSMSLSYSIGQNSFSNVNSAYDFGSDSGETSEGIAVAWTGYGEAKLGCGPSFLYGMWNVSANRDMALYSGRITPSNAFLFVSEGSSYSSKSASWVPLPASGNFSFQIPLSDYSVKAMLSNYEPVTSGLKSGMVIELNLSLTEEIYTPLYAMSNAQAAAISFFGNGSVSSPYFLFDNTVQTFGQEFSVANAVGYPVFSGFLLMNVSHANINGLPVLHAAVSSGAAVALPDVLYDTSGVSIWRTQFSELPSFTALLQDVRLFPDLTVINSSADLIGSSNFSGGFAGVYIYKGTGNYVWGNTFVANETNPGQFGIIVNSSDNTIFNNYFWGQQVPAFSCFVTNTDAVQLNRWNISRTPSSSVTIVNRYILSGSIIHLNYQGGNYWWNFNGTVPFSEGSLISVPDYVPLIPSSTLDITEHGLPSGTAWSVVVNGSSTTLTSNAMLMYLPDGNYTYSVQPTRYYYPGGGAGVAELDGNQIRVTVNFNRFGFILGRVNPGGSHVTVNNETVSVDNGTFAIPVREGSSSIAVTSPGYIPFRENLTLLGGENKSLQISLLAEQHYPSVIPLLFLLIAVISSAAVTLIQSVPLLRMKLKKRPASALKENGRKIRRR